MSDDDFSVPDGWELAEGNEWPGEPLHPGENTIVNSGNNPLQKGETIAVWAKHYDGHTTGVCRVDLQVIGDDDGDIIAIFDHENPLEASQVFRIRANLGTLAIGHVYAIPEYDSEEGLLTVTREVKVHGQDAITIVEVRSLGGRQDWVMPGGDL